MERLAGVCGSAALQIGGRRVDATRFLTERAPASHGMRTGSLSFLGVFGAFAIGATS